jgi:hypothetical protein
MIMGTTKKIAISIGIAGGALIAAWLLTGDRKQKTKDFLVKKAQDIKQTLKKDVQPMDDSDIHYI